ncbi:MAG: phasin family protein [Pseudolabrys sp.]|jgi:hypothetical protein|nr:phasin family protein [Pseudolabrys sp.]
MGSTSNPLQELAIGNLHQMQNAVNEAISAARKNAALIEWSASAAQSEARQVWLKALGFAEQNAASSFEFAQNIAKVTNLHELLGMQADFAKSQMQALANQATDLGETLTTAIKNAAGSEKVAGA